MANDGVNVQSTVEGARWVNLVLGVWLFISAFIWPHSQASQTNSWILGAIIALVSVLAMRDAKLRLVNTGAAIWLFISTLVIAHVSSGTYWNNLIVAVAVFILSLAGPSGTWSGLRREGQTPLAPR